MAIVHNLEIVWDELLDAFTSGKGDRVYFLDRHTGEIFFVPTGLEDEEFWRQMDGNLERYLEIPAFDYGVERQVMSSFIGVIEDKALKQLLGASIAGRKPYGKLNDILSFFPDELERLAEIRDEFLTTRVKNWLETNDLITVETELMRMTRI